MNYRNLLDLFQKICVRVGVSVLGIHALRHTFASNCYKRGVKVKVLSKMLGHANTSITYNTYIHMFDDELQDEMIQAVGI